VTGGTGSIGSVIVKTLLSYKPKQIRVYSRDETKQFNLANELGPNVPVAFLVGDIRDKERLHMAMENIDIVFHAAALKHVLSCERNPFEAVKTNVQGTQNVIDCAFANKVDKVVGISTDKATDPSSVMGCTKLLAEKIMLATYFYKGSKKTKFSFVRFGNVLGSRGSVVPLFFKQAMSGGPVTITDPEMTRFFMSIPQAVGLILKAVTMMKDREIFILKMPSARIKDMAQAVIEIVGKDKGGKEIRIKSIGKKNGERLHEKLLTEEESSIALDTKDMFIILSYLAHESDTDKKYSQYYSGAKKFKRGEYSSESQKPMTMAGLKTLLLRYKEENV